MSYRSNGNRRLTLDQAEHRPDSRPWREGRKGYAPPEYLRVIDCGGCWCGEPSGHDWPGKAEGAPHPR